MGDEHVFVTAVRAFCEINAVEDHIGEATFGVAVVAAGECGGLAAIGAVVFFVFIASS